MMKRALFLLKSPPYGTLRLTEGYRAALGTAASGTPTEAVLLGDGVYAALKGQNSADIDQACVAELMEGLADMGVEVCILGEGAAERHLTDEDLLPFRRITAEELKTKIRAAHAVLTF